jgi:hypothetical protein
MRQAEDDGTVEDDDPRTPRPLGDEMNVLVLIPVSSLIHVALDPKKPMAGFIKLGRSFALEYTAGGKPACSQWFWLRLTHLFRSIRHC